MRRVAIIIMVFSISFSCRFTRNEPDKSEIKQPVKPKFIWQMYKNPEDAGFSKEAIQEIEEYYQKTDLATLFVVYKGNVLLALGDYQRRFNCHSIRKSLMNSVVGIGYDEGKINLNKTLADLQIDDLQKLSVNEKQATVREILQSRSGIYHPAVYETPSMERSKPQRGSFRNGEHWYYNNWDFNVLSTIVEQEMEDDFLSLFAKRIAEPIGLEDYREFDGNYFVDSTISFHKAYGFKLSARDLARFGLLYLQNGVWQHQRVLSEDWIKQSTASYSNSNTIRGGYGYLWWIPKADKSIGFAACGIGTQVLLVIPELDLIIVQRVNTYIGKKHPFDLKLYEMIVRAKTGSHNDSSEFVALPDIDPVKSYYIESGEKYIGKYRAFDGIYLVRLHENGLLIEYPKGLKSQLIPTVISNEFIAEDVQEVVRLEWISESGVGNLIIIGSVHSK